MILNQHNTFFKHYYSRKLFQHYNPTLLFTAIKLTIYFYEFCIFVHRSSMHFYIRMYRQVERDGEQVFSTPNINITYCLLAIPNILYRFFIILVWYKTIYDFINNNLGLGLHTWVQCNVVRRYIIEYDNKGKVSEKSCFHILITHPLIFPYILCATIL